MKINLRVSGGMGIAFDGSLSIEELPQQIKPSIRHALNAEYLAEVEQRQGNPLQTDVQIYQIGLIEEAKDIKVFTINETQCTPELLDILDELTVTLKKNLVAGRGNSR